MYKNPEMYVNSAKQLVKFNEERKKEAMKIKTAEKLVAEQVALLKESNELAKKTLAKSKYESRGTNLVDIKLSIMGISLNISEVWRRFKNRSSKSRSEQPKL